MKHAVGIMVLSALLALPTLAQPAPPSAPGMTQPSLFSPSALRQMDRAQRELTRAQYLASLVGDTSLKREADALLQQAQREFQGQAYFQALERAKTASAIYEALRFLEVAPRQSFFSGRPGPSRAERRVYTAPYRAQEAIARAEYEASFYNVRVPLVARLLEEAKGLLAQGGDLARSEAANHLARATHHLIRAKRGF